MRGDASPFPSIYYHLHIRDIPNTTARLHIYGRDPRRTRSRGRGLPLLLETCDTIAFDLQINRESVHLGEDGRCDG